MARTRPVAVLGARGRLRVFATVLVVVSVTVSDVMPVVLMPVFMLVLQESIAHVNVVGTARDAPRLVPSAQEAARWHAARGVREACATRIAPKPSHGLRRVARALHRVND